MGRLTGVRSLLAGPVLGLAFLLFLPLLGIAAVLWMLARSVGRVFRGGARRDARAVLAVAFTSWSIAGADAELPEEVQECLDCHEDPDGVADLEDGSTMSVFVDGEAFAASVHGSELVCADCHVAYDEDHPFEGPFPSRRAYVIASYGVCKECHFDAYTRNLDSVHYELVKSGEEKAPVCADCHGAHDVHNPREKRAMVSRACATCHRDVFEVYARSVHGAALVDDGNEDVPACADCHTNHEIMHPHGARFRLGSPETCANCHRDPARMAPYGISTDVARTYLADFHGVTASLGKNVATDSSQVVVTCFDCHGHHSIGSPRKLGHEAMQQAVASACARCHPNAAPDFPAAWLSHYEPSLQHAPLVYIVDTFYRFFIPFVVVGLVAHVFLDLRQGRSGR